VPKSSIRRQSRNHRPVLTAASNAVQTRRARPFAAPGMIEQANGDAARQEVNGAGKHDQSPTRPQRAAQALGPFRWCGLCHREFIAVRGVTFCCRSPLLFFMAGQLEVIGTGRQHWTTWRPTCSLGTPRRRCVGVSRAAMGPHSLAASTARPERPPRRASLFVCAFSCCKFAAPSKRTSHEAWTWRPDRPVGNRHRSARLSNRRR